MPSEFKVTITLGNDAMQSPDDVSDALERVVAALRRNGFVRHAQNIRDDNGNRVGQYKAYDDDSED